MEIPIENQCCPHCGGILKRIPKSKTRSPIVSIISM